MRVLLLTTEHDPASRLMAHAIYQHELPRGVSHQHLHEDLLTLTTPPEDADVIIFLSRHQAREKQPVFTIHSIGIPDEQHPQGGLVPTNPALLTHIYTRLTHLLREIPLHTPRGAYTTALEATHHGPLISMPSIFIELGTHEEHWQDSEAAAWLIHHLLHILTEPFQKRESIFLIGGNHYCASAQRILPHADLAGCLARHTVERIGPHILSILASWYDMLLLDWDGLPGGEKQRIASILTEQGIHWEKLKAWRRRQEKRETSPSP